MKGPTQLLFTLYAKYACPVLFCPNSRDKTIREKRRNSDIHVVYSVSESLLQRICACNLSRVRIIKFFLQIRCCTMWCVNVLSTRICLD